MLQSHPVQKLHGDEGLAVLLANVVDGADVGVIQSGCGLGFALEAGEGLRVAGNFLGQKLERDETVKPRVFGFVDHAHTAAAQLLENAVVRNRLANHWQGMLRGENDVVKVGWNPVGWNQVPFWFAEITFCRGGILRGWRIAGRAIHHSWMRSGRDWPTQRWRLLNPNLPERDERPRHCRVRRALCRPSTTGLRYPEARSWRCGRGHFYRPAGRPARLPDRVPGRAKAARHSPEY